MWQKIKCLFGWHDLETFCFHIQEDEPNLAYEHKKCKICGKIISIPTDRKRVFWYKILEKLDE